MLTEKQIASLTNLVHKYGADSDNNESKDVWKKIKAEFDAEFSEYLTARTLENTWLQYKKDNANSSGRTLYDSAEGISVLSVQSRGSRSRTPELPGSSSLSYDQDSSKSSSRRSRSRKTEKIEENEKERNELAKRKVSSSLVALNTPQKTPPRTTRGSYVKKADDNSSIRSGRSSTKTPVKISGNITPPSKLSPMLKSPGKRTPRRTSKKRNLNMEMSKTDGEKSLEHNLRRSTRLLQTPTKNYTVDWTPPPNDLTPSTKLALKLQDVHIDMPIIHPEKYLQDGILDEDELLEDRVSASPTPEGLMARIKRRKRTALDEVKLRLHTSEIPQKLIKREAEYKQIYDFVLNGVTKRQSQALYISGVPGTGKTASVMKVIENIKKQKKATFKFVAVNALELSNPKRLFCVIYKEFTKNSKNISAACVLPCLCKYSLIEWVSSIRKLLENNMEHEKAFVENAQQKLNDMFATIDKKRLPLVLLVDEVDMLYTKRQEVVYTVFNWSAMEGSKVSVIAISNTLDLPERILAPRVASRLGSKRLCFQPYGFQELIEIIQHRIDNCPAIAKEAVEFASRKIGALSGDLRKALELLRRAIDIAIEECEEKGGDLMKVKLLFSHVNAAIQESTKSMRMDFCHTMGQDEELLFRALVNDLKRSNMEETTFFRLLAEYKDLCNDYAIDPLPAPNVFRILMELAGSNFLSLSSEIGQMNRRIMLNLPLSEAQFCIRQMDERKNNPADSTKIKTL